MTALIKKANSAIGKNTSTDYKITPTEFPLSLEKTAPEISKILRHSSFQEKAKRYEKHDATAIAAQTKFKTFSQQATWSICLAAIAGSVLAALSAAYGKQSEILFVPLLMLGSISTLAGSLAVFRLFQIKSQNLLENWMTARANAETERLGYFNAAARYLVKNFKPDIYLQLLFVCMFKRYQLDVQCTYYTQRGAQHKQSRVITSNIGAAAAILLALGSGVLGVTGAFINELLPFAALGTVGAAISALASRREELNQDERNAERYSRTADILSKLAEKHDDVLDIVNEGNNPEIIIRYVDAINDQLSLEHRQWTSDAAEMSAALFELENSMTEIQKKT